MEKAAGSGFEEYWWMKASWPHFVGMQRALAPGPGKGVEDFVAEFVVNPVNPWQNAHSDKAAGYNLLWAPPLQTLQYL
jgi:hypothetical protein